MATIFLGKIDIIWRNMEIYKWKWMVIGALGCMNNADFEVSKKERKKERKKKVSNFVLQDW